MNNIWKLLKLAFKHFNKNIIIIELITVVNSLKLPLKIESPKKNIAIEIGQLNNIDKHM